MPLKVTTLCTSLLIASCGSEDKLRLGEEKNSSKEAEIAAQMIDAIKDISMQRSHQGELMQRFNQVKTLACFDAEFRVGTDLPKKLQKGLFAEPAIYPAILRFANATKMDDTEKDFRGLSIKVRGVAGKPLWGIEGEQDFLLNSYPVLFAANPDDFLAFIEATRQDQIWKYFINPLHFYSLRIVLKGREKISNPFAIRYWSTTPYRYGTNSSSAVKYSVRPCSDEGSDIMVKTHPDFLRDAMQQHLDQKGEACFNLMIQFQTDPQSMPVENASKMWSESESPFEKVASIHIKPDATSDITQANCESMTFNPWQSQPEHKPIGGINRVRLAVYSEIGRYRQQENQRRKSP